MRIILKLLAAPFVLALTLLVAVLNFAFSFASWVFCALSFLCLIGALFALFTGDRWGIQGLVIAFAVSPFGLAAVAEWLIDKLDSLNYSLKSLSRSPLRRLDGQPPFSFGRRCAHGYNLYPALQGGGWERRCPDNGGTL
mgnify:CR=1 FL=1